MQQIKQQLQASRTIRFAGYPKLLVVSPKSTVGWNRGLTEILQNQLWDGIVGYSIKKW